MDQRQLASVLFAVVGVFIAASRLPEIFFHVAMLAEGNRASQDPAGPVSQRLVTIVAFSVSLLAVLIGAGLALGRDRLANRLFPTATEPLDAPEAQAVALSVLGCYFAVQGLSRMLWGLGAVHFDWMGATQLALGAGLFVGARGLARLWSLTRSAGRPT